MRVQQLRREAQGRNAILIGYEKKGKWKLSTKKLLPVSYIPAHQEPNKPSEPDEFAKQGNIAADEAANKARKFPTKPDSIMPTHDKRFVATVNCRLLCGDFARFLRKLGEMHAVGMQIEDVVDLRQKIRYALHEPDHEPDLDQEGELTMQSHRRPQRHENTPRPDYNQDIEELNEPDEEGQIEVSSIQMQGEKEQHISETSKPTTQGVVIKALIANPAFNFNPNGSMSEVLIAGHRMASHTRQIRGNPKLMSILTEYRALAQCSAGLKEPDFCKVIDMCPLCSESEEGGAYGNQEHMILFCPAMEQERIKLFTAIEQCFKTADPFVGQNWKDIYPGEEEFIADQRYADRFPRLFGMRWLLPLLSPAGKRISSNIANTWFLSHKTVVDLRLLQGLTRAGMPKQSAELCVAQIQQKMITGITQIAKQAQSLLGKEYSKIRKALQSQDQPTDDASKTSNTPSKKRQKTKNPTTDPPNQTEKHLYSTKHKDTKFTATSR